MMRGMLSVLLPHTAVLKSPALAGTLSDVYSETTLSRVRIETDEKLNGGRGGETRGRGGVLYYDCAASRPRGISFAEGQKIVFDGKEYEIAEIRRGATDKPLFYRISLV